MSRTRFWTILLGSDSTSFRAADRETLLPTLVQLQRRHPDAVIRWFERGQLFDSPEAAEAARFAIERERRPRDWRPGGDHRDPRAKYDIPRDEKRRRFKERAKRDRMEQQGAPSGGRPPARPRSGGSTTGGGPRPPRASRPGGASSRPSGPGRGPRKPRQG